MLDIKRGDQFYLGHPTTLWCECTGANSKGWISFDVHNGNWAGKLDVETLAITHRYGTYPGSEPLWVGKAPFVPWQYNAAIEWIEDQLPPDKKRPY